ncbi:integrase [Epilithonimonas hungarica]|uniref:phage integrase SAM-like domain-containing protein n=1 Tax=Epilithonimonas hungarica TaxID=454006 RepID=UPI002784B7FB|nr:phage integrase SAM-like domain-containing protein [Epilithonimonas hungarica]MDP9956856.1 integrase [Epilithonimonas hungarica]
MASVSFFIRGKILDKESTVWTRFRDKKIDIKTPVPYLKCKPKDWKDGKCKLNSKKVSEIDSETINVRLLKLENEILSKYQSVKPEIDLKEWLELVIVPQKMKSEGLNYSDDVLSFFDVYIATKSKSVSKSTIKKTNVVKNLIERYVLDKQSKKRTFTNLKFKDLNNDFRIDFENYCQEQQYKVSTTYRNLKFLKMICKVAMSFDIEVNRHVENWRFEVEKAGRNSPKSIYLTLKDLEKIEESDMPHDYLENAKDWLIIACFTAQRVSDYLRFTSSMIVTDNDGQEYIEFVQQKTNAKMQIPLLKKVKAILNKRQGEFPRKISDVNLNLYIKEVCKIAGIDDKIYNGKVQTIEREDKSKITRKVFAEYPKYELVTSHIGRKSFASNFYEKIPTAYLLNFTGHKSENQLLSYISKTDIEKAKSTADVFANLGY